MASYTVAIVPLRNDLNTLDALRFFLWVSCAIFLISFVWCIVFVCVHLDFFYLKPSLSILFILHCLNVCLTFFSKYCNLWYHQDFQRCCDDVYLYSSASAVQSQFITTFPLQLWRNVRSQLLNKDIVIYFYFAYSFSGQKHLYTKSKACSFICRWRNWRT